MSTIIETEHLSRHFGQVRAVDDVTISLEDNRIYGLLGRNGAGKTTLMQLLTGQSYPSQGQIRVYGQHPDENSPVLQQMSFVKESQKYPDNFKPRHVIEAGPWFYENWNQPLADRLIADFRLPMNRPIKKLSRGQLSSVGVILGLASRAPITFFDEPYLGLDAVARSIFYDRLLEDYAEFPRTVILSTHLIDEVANLLEHVLVINDGRILLNEDADTLRTRAFTVAGKAAEVDAFIGSREVIGRDSLGALASVTVYGSQTEADRRDAETRGLELAPVSLQQLIVRLTTDHAAAAAA
jgi:ABC-2 type transport system ATP-binding protein